MNTIKCKGCDIEFIPRTRQQVTCSQKCKKRYSRANDTYTANNIKVLHDLHDEKYDWVLVKTIAHEYNKPVELVERSVKACRIAGVSPQYFIDKYILHKTLPIDDAVQHASRELQRQHTR